MVHIKTCAYLAITWCFTRAMFNVIYGSYLITCKDDFLRWCDLDQYPDININVLFVIFGAFFIEMGFLFAGMNICLIFALRQVRRVNDYY